MTKVSFDAQEMRDTITGKMQWRRCASCDGTGVINYNEDGQDIKSGLPDEPDRQIEDCDNCHAVGFLPIPSYE